MFLKSLWIYLILWILWLDYVPLRIYWFVFFGIRLRGLSVWHMWSVSIHDPVGRALPPLIEGLIIYLNIFMIILSHGLVSGGAAAVIRKINGFSPLSDLSLLLGIWTFIFDLESYDFVVYLWLFEVMAQLLGRCFHGSWDIWFQLPYWCLIDLLSLY